MYRIKLASMIPHELKCIRLYEREWVIPLGLYIHTRYIEACTVIPHAGTAAPTEQVQ